MSEPPRQPPSRPEVTPILMSAPEAAQYLGVSEDMLATLVSRGLPCWRPNGGQGPGSRRLFHRTAIEDWVLAQMKAESGKGASAKPATAKSGKGKPKAGKGSERWDFG